MPDTKDSHTPHRPPPMPRFSWRLTYAYQGDDIRLVQAEHLRMIAPASVGPVPVAGQTGHWLEVHGAGGELLYHRTLAEFVPHDREVFTDEPGRSMHRVPVDVVEGEFDVLVPDMPGAERFSLHGHAASAKRRGAATVLTRASFKELARAPHSR